MSSSSSSASSSSAAADGWGVTWDQLDKKRYYGMTLATSICTRLVLYPVNMAKTRVQHEGSGDATTPRKSEGTLRLLHRVAKEEGVARLYRGFMFNTVLGLVGGPYFLTVIERSRSFYRDELGFSPTMASSAAGLSATFASQLLFVPSDNVTQRLMVKSSHADAAGKNTAEATSGFDQARQLYRTGGVPRFYRGIGISLLVYAPTSMLFWPTYTNLRAFTTDALERQGLGDASKWLAAPACASIGGSFAMSCTTPLDAVKTRMQLSAGATTVATARELFRKEGAGGFTLGLRMRASSGAFMYPVFLTSYEFVKWYATIDTNAADCQHHDCADGASACGVLGAPSPEQ